MLLNSYSFLLVFLPVVVVLYWLIPRGYPRLLFLIVASLVFYGLWDWRYIPLLLGDDARRLGRRALPGQERGRGREPPPQAAPGRRRHRQPRAARLLQVPRLLRRLAGRPLQPGRRRRAAAGAQGAAADRHLLLHVRRHLVRGGRVPRHDPPGQERDPLPGLGHAVPVPPGRPDHPLRPRGRAARALAAALPLGAHRHRPLLPRHGPRQEDAGRRHDGALRQRPVRAPRPPRPALRLGAPPSATRCSCTSTSPATATWPWAWRS